jgi:hypothetical protein
MRGVTKSVVAQACTSQFDSTVTRPPPSFILSPCYDLGVPPRLLRCLEPETPTMNQHEIPPSSLASALPASFRLMLHLPDGIHDPSPAPLLPLLDLLPGQRDVLRVDDLRRVISVVLSRER